MRLPAVAAVLAGALMIPALAKLPALSDEAKAKAAEAAVKAAWTDKVGAYQLCQAMDRKASAYRHGVSAAGNVASAPDATPPCTDPGPFVAQAPAEAKPLEASGAHSPPGMATWPPSSKATSAEISGPRK